MSTFSQWWSGFRKSPEAKQVTWLCGTEAVLIEDVIANLKWAVQPEPWNYAPLVLGEATEREIWAEVAQLPVGTSKRLVVIRGAEKLKQTDRIIDFIRTRTLNSKTFVIFVSNEERARRTEPTKEQPKGELVDFLQAFSGKGQIIECRPFTQATAKVAVEWVHNKVTMREGLAAYLLNRTAGDLRLVRDVCRKLALFPGEPTRTAINEMLAERPRDNFVDALVALDKKTALLALERLPVGDYSRTIGQLDSQLDFAGMVHDMLVEHRSPTEIARAAGNKNFLVQDIIPKAKHYDSKRRLEIRKMLATADETIRGGESIGVMESLVAWW